MNKILIIYILICCIPKLSSFYAIAGNLISPTVSSNGVEYDIEDTFSDPIELRFSLIDRKMSGEWKMWAKLKNNSYELLYSTANKDGNFSFIPDDVSWPEAYCRKHIYDMNLDRFISPLKIEFIADNGVTDSFEIRIALIPQRPRISEVAFKYEYNWAWDDIYPNGWFSLKIESKGAAGYNMNYSRSHLHSPDDAHMLFEYEQSFDYTPTETIGYDADWGEYICFDAINKYGAVRSDTICTTSYITDKKILDRIEELKKQSKIKYSILSDSDYSYHGNILSFNKPMKDISVYTSNGILTKHSSEINEINLEELTSGIYIIKYIDNINNTQTIKLYKK